MPIRRGKAISHPAVWCIRKADWPTYQREIRRRILEVADSNQTANTDEVYKTFTNIIEATKVAVPRGRRKKGKAWWNDVVETAVRAARDAKDAWLECPEDEELEEIWKIQQRATTRCIRNAKWTSYQELLDGMDPRKDPGAPFRLIKEMDALNGNPRDAAIKHRTGVAASAKEKADLAIAHYASISRLIRNKTNDKEVRARSRPLPTCRDNCDFCAPFTMCELNTVLSNQNGKAPGNDQVFPWMIKNLLLEGKEELLRLCNLSWKKGEVPCGWRRATISPLLKSGKPVDKIGSFRPVSLTSIIYKICERLEQARLSFWQESNKILNPAQAGFRACRSTEEQVARVVQLAMDGVNASPHMERTLLVLVDFSRAYDRVW
jgi:hypothetical protein